MASLVKTIEEAKAKYDDLIVTVVGVDGVRETELEEFHKQYQPSLPLAVLSKDERTKHLNLSVAAAVTVIGFNENNMDHGTVILNFAFRDTKSAAEKAKEIVTAAEKSLK